MSVVSGTIPALDTNFAPGPRRASGPHNSASVGFQTVFDDVLAASVRSGGPGKSRGRDGDSARQKPVLQASADVEEIDVEEPHGGEEDHPRGLDDGSTALTAGAAVVVDAAAQPSSHPTSAPAADVSLQHASGDRTPPPASGPRGGNESAAAATRFVPADPPSGESVGDAAPVLVQPKGRGAGKSLRERVEHPGPPGKASVQGIQIGSAIPLGLSAVRVPEQTAARTRAGSTAVVPRAETNPLDGEAAPVHTRLSLDDLPTSAARVAGTGPGAVSAPDLRSPVTVDGNEPAVPQGISSEPEVGLRHLPDTAAGGAAANVRALSAEATGLLPSAPPAGEISPEATWASVDPTPPRAQGMSEHPAAGAEKATNQEAAGVGWPLVAGAEPVAEGPSSAAGEGPAAGPSADGAAPEADGSPPPADGPAPASDEPPRAAALRTEPLTPGGAAPSPERPETTSDTPTGAARGAGGSIGADGLDVSFGQRAGGVDGSLPQDVQDEEPPFEPTPTDAAVSSLGEPDAAETDSRLAATKDRDATLATLAKTIEELVESFVRERGPGGEERVTIKLHPEHLGRLVLRVAVDEAGVVQARFVADNPAVRALIEQDLPHLRASLEEKGLLLGEAGVEADVSSNPGADPGAFFADGQERSFREPGAREPSAARRTMSADAGLAGEGPEPEPVPALGTIDIRV